MAIGTPTIIGTQNSASTSLGQTITTTGAIATHDVAILWHYCAAAAGGITGQGAGLSDTSGNNYIRLLNFSAGAPPLLEVYIVYDAIAMASSSSIITTGYGATGRRGLYVVSISGLLNSTGVFDRHTGQTAERSTGTSSPSTAILNAAAAQEIVLTISVAGAALGTGVPTTNYTALTALATNAWMYPEYRILSSPSAQSSNPSWANSVAHLTASIGLVGIPATNTSRQAQGTLLGVGV